MSANLKANSIIFTPSLGNLDPKQQDLEPKSKPENVTGHQNILNSLTESSYGEASSAGKKDAAPAGKSFKNSQKTLTRIGVRFKQQQM